MKKNTGNRIKLGVFVTLGTLLFITGIYFVGKRQNLFSSTFALSAMFKDVSGLQPGNNIRFAGINVGIIDNIIIVNDTSIQVDMQIQAEIQKFIKNDSRAIIGSEGLMGNKILIITPGTTNGVMVKKNAFIATSAPVNMDEILQNLKVTIENTALLTGDLSLITSNIRSGKGTIGKLFMDSTLAEDLNKTVGTVKKGAAGFQENMEAAKSNFLLRGYFRKKEKNEEKAKEEQQGKTSKQPVNSGREQVKNESQPQQDTIKSSSKRKRNRNAD